MDWGLFWTASGAMGAMLAGAMAVAIFCLEWKRLRRETSPRYEVDLTQLETDDHRVAIRLVIINLNETSARLADMRIERPRGAGLGVRDVNNPFIKPKGQMFWDVAVIPPPSASPSFDLRLLITIETRSARISETRLSIERSITARPSSAAE